ncbi:hypothetical protein ANANG_G00232280 [Anguilla anguilla]|uniref:Uncharacterized protein n=1 Tax=Anguilla anguilla TaxID=7936 RepID=A0A9D3LW05_ANGAN|nr:hypothetical protein ANANG_G00232280 [Anguilla anguilla]
MHHRLQAQPHTPPNEPALLLTDGGTSWASTQRSVQNQRRGWTSTREFFSEKTTRF